MTILLFFAAAFIAAFFLWQYVFSVYETKAKLAPHKTAYFIGENVSLRVEPLNSFGKCAPLRKVTANIEITKGKDLISVKRLSEDEFELKTLAEGTAEIEVESRFSRQKEILKIKIVSKEDEKKHN